MGDKYENKYENKYEDKNEENYELKDYPFSNYNDFCEAFEIMLNSDMYYYALPCLSDKLNTFTDEKKGFNSIIEEIAVIDTNFDNALDKFIECFIRSNNLAEEYLEIADDIIKYFTKRGATFNNYLFLKFNYEIPNEKYTFYDEIENYEVRGKLIDICYKYGLDLDKMIDWDEIIARNTPDINDEIIKQHGASYKFNHHHCLSYLKLTSEKLKAFV